MIFVSKGDVKDKSSDIGSNIMEPMKELLGTTKLCFNFPFNLHIL